MIIKLFNISQEKSGFVHFWKTLKRLTIFELGAPITKRLTIISTIKRSTITLF